MKKISLIVTTYNKPDALALVLQALAAQKGVKFSFEVIIADDGSTPETAALIKQLQPDLPYSLQLMWQEDKGFRAAMARNRAIAMASGDYLIFLDGDCIPQTDFIARHLQLAENGWFVAGNRILLSEKFTALLLKNSLALLKKEGIKKEGIWTRHITEWLLPYLRRDINRLLPLLRLPDSSLRKFQKQKWQGAKTCNLAVWRKDILKINGFDEQFQGWGHEDAELVVRLLHSGTRRKEGRFSVPVLHLWHQEQDRHQEKKNRQRLEQRLINQDLPG
ncbi:MAG: glycosyltransferase family 2 protein [Thiomargarita sp.]|nr:glycosyltransferase family 2 protein [Thiomargarita sp.]